MRRFGTIGVMFGASVGLGEAWLPSVVLGKVVLPRNDCWPATSCSLVPIRFASFLNLVSELRARDLEGESQSAAPGSTGHRSDCPGLDLFAIDFLEKRLVVVVVVVLARFLRQIR